MVHPNPQSRRRAGLGHQPGLDGLRGVAVLAVIAYHLDPGLAPRGGAVGVTLFFALSGYLITTLLLREVDAGGRPRLGHFYARRALRLFPALLLLVVAVAVYAAWLAPAGRGGKTLTALPYVVLYVGNWYRAATGFGSLGLLDHTWSLSVEEQFYLVWPLVLTGVVLLARGGRRWLLAVALAGSVAPLVVRLALWQGPEVSGARVYNGTDTAADPLMMGCALALLLALAGGRAGHPGRPGEEPPGTARPGGEPPGAARPCADRPGEGTAWQGALHRWLRVGAWPAAALLTADAVLRLGGGGRGTVIFDLLWGPTVLGLASVLVVGATVVGATVVGATAVGATVVGPAAVGATAVGGTVVRPAALLRWAPLRAVGVISYGLYLWHFPAIRVVQAEQLPVVTGRWVALVATFAIAGASYVLLERPLLGLKSRFPPAQRSSGATNPQPDSEPQPAKVSG